MNSSNMLKFSCLLLLKFLVLSCQEDGHNSAIELTTDEFTNLIGSNNYFILFYAPWCSHCIKFRDTWEELAEMLNEPNSRVTVAKVDCTTEKTICQEQEITSYPTILYFKKYNESPAIKFSGTRDLTSLANFLNVQLGTNVIEYGIGEVRPSGPLELTDDNFLEHVSKGKHFIKFYAPWCGHCQHLSPTWENVGITFAPHESVTIGKIDCTTNRISCRAYDIKSYPTLLWIEDGKKVEKYQGMRTVDDLESFVNERLTDSGEKLPKAVFEAEEPQAVLPLFKDSFNAGIAFGITFVKYYAPWCGHCKKLAPTWQALGSKFKEDQDISIAEVNCARDENRQLCDSQEVDGFPTLILYKNGIRIDRYSGSRNLSDLKKYVAKHAGLNEHDEL